MVGLRFIVAIVVQREGEWGDMNSARGVIFERNKRPETFYELLLERAGLWKAMKDCSSCLPEDSIQCSKKRGGRNVRMIVFSAVWCIEFKDNVYVYVCL